MIALVSIYMVAILASNADLLWLTEIKPAEVVRIEVEQKKQYIDGGLYAAD